MFEELEQDFYKSEAEVNKVSREHERGERLLEFLFAAAAWCSPIIITDRDGPLERKSGSKCRILDTRRGKSGLHSVYISTNRLIRGKCSIWHITIYCYITYVAVYLIGTLIAGLQWERDYQQWQPRLRPGAQQNGSCVLKRDIVNSTMSNKSYQEAWLAKRFANIDYFSCFETLSEFFFLSIIGSILAQIGAMVHLWHQQPSRIGVFSFLLNPGAERARFRQTLVKLVHNMFNCPDFAEQVEQVLVSKCRCLRPSMHSQKTKHLTKRHNRTDFLRLVFEEKLYRRVKPKSLSYNSISRYHKYVQVMFWLILFTMAIFLLVNLGTMILYQLYRRVSERLEKASCELWNPEGQLRKHRIDFEDQFWLEKRHVYMHFNPKVHSALPLYWLEFRHLSANQHFLIFIINHIIYFIIFIWWFILYSAIYVSNFSFQLVWMNDVQRQLNTLNLMMTYALGEETHFEKQLEQTIKQAKSDGLLGEEDEQILRHQAEELDKIRHEKRARSIYKALTTTYFNFELFRRQYEHSQWLANHIAGLTVIMMLSIIGWAYISDGFRSTEIYSYIILLINAGGVVFVNCLFISSSMIIIRMRRIANSLLLCFANSSDLSINMSYIVTLWRRQLMCDRDFRASYSMSLLGYELSPGNLLTLNSYLFAIVLIIYKTYYS